MKLPRLKAWASSRIALKKRNNHCDAFTPAFKAGASGVGVSVSWEKPFILVGNSALCHNERGFFMQRIIAVLGIFLLLVTLGCVNSVAPPTKNADGSMTKEDGTIVKADGTMVKPDGTMVKPDGTMIKPDGTMIKPDGTMIGPDGKMIDTAQLPPAGTTGNVAYVPFTLAAYTKAKSEGKTIFLEFYANWCPICQAQAPALEAGIPQISSDTLVAFRVNYKDSETDADEQALAQKFNITYQHTHVVIGPDETIQLKSQESWSEQQVVEKLTPFA